MGRSKEYLEYPCKERFKMTAQLTAYIIDSFMCIISLSNFSCNCPSCWGCQLALNWVMTSAGLDNSKLKFGSGLSLNVNSSLESVLSFEDSHYHAAVCPGGDGQPAVFPSYRAGAREGLESH